MPIALLHEVFDLARWSRAEVVPSYEMCWQVVSGLPRAVMAICDSPIGGTVRGRHDDEPIMQE